jgi:3-oxoacyl-(acyl-carrier-protein) synthase
LQVNYINAHATSTLAGDLAEVNAIKQVFKDPSGIKINATKVFQLINIISDIDSLPLPDC